jgi:hypothetical protein
MANDNDKIFPAVEPCDGSEGPQILIKDDAKDF